MVDPRGPKFRLQMESSMLFYMSESVYYLSFILHFIFAKYLIIFVILYISRK